MAFIPTAATAKIAINATINGEGATITMHFEATVNFDVATLTALANAVIDWVVASLAPLLSTGVSFDSVDATAMHSDSAPSINVPFTGGLTGSVASAVLPQQVAFVVTHQTVNRGRSFRGRNYVYGIPTNAELSAGIVTATFAANMVAAFADIADIEAATGDIHVVNSLYHNNAARTAGVNTEVDSYRVDQPLDTQRRRSVGRGT